MMMTNSECITGEQPAASGAHGTRIPLLFLIRGLPAHGAERQLLELVRGLDKARYVITVATFYGGGALRAEMEAIPGIRVESLEKQGRWDVLPFFLRLLALVRAVAPRIIHGYMTEANLLALLCGWLAHARVVWGIRGSNKNYAHYDWVTRTSFRLSILLSCFANLIIFNSEAGKHHHLCRGYAARHVYVVPNGFDIQRFHPDDALRKRQRRCWKVGAHDTLIGIIGRLDPIKNHHAFLQAAALLVQEPSYVRFVCVGRGEPAYQLALHACARGLGIETRVCWVESCSDMPAAYNALDILVNVSHDEAFSNVIGEAMACGVPCVVTDVGDSALLVGSTGRVVPRDDPSAIARACCELLALPPAERARLADEARDRIAGHYSQTALIQRTHEVLEALL